MIKLSDQENSKLEILGKDTVAVEALRKVLLNVCLKRTNEALPELAASRLAMDYIERALKELELPRQKEKELQEGNIAL